MPLPLYKPAKAAVAPGGVAALDEDPERDADEVERYACPRCAAEPGSPCRSRSGSVTTAYHTGRFTKVPRLAKQLRVATPADRGPGTPWREGIPVLAAVPDGVPSADIRIGYAISRAWDVSRSGSVSLS